MRVCRKPEESTAGTPIERPDDKELPPFPAKKTLPSAKAFYFETPNHAAIVLRKQHIFSTHFWECGAESPQFRVYMEKSRIDCGALALAGVFRGVYRRDEACRNLRRIVVAIFLQRGAGPREKCRVMPFRVTVGKGKATGLPRCLIFLNKARWGGDGGV